MEAVVFTGIQGAGKSTFYRERFFDTHVRINLDMLRTRRREEILVTACLQSGQNFVVDNTNLLASDRLRYAAPARAAAFRVVAYVFKTDLRDALQRNSQRAGKQKVPAAAIASAFKKLVEPSPEEGFDEIYMVELRQDRSWVVTAVFPKP
jgi:predicted kinase